ncbi:MAG: NUDIX hydrolase [Rhodospirillaceae bacterium]
MTEPRPRGPNTLKTPEGDDRLRKTCLDCGFIHYENPKVIVGAVCTWQESPAAPELYLMARRGIEPRLGFWTMPAGYMELNETTEAGAAREVWEEARARVEIDALLGLYNIPRINQVHLIYRARMLTAAHGAGSESIETALFTWEELPWHDLAFPTVEWALKAHHALRGHRDFAPQGVPPEDVNRPPFG